MKSVAQRMMETASVDMAPFWQEGPLEVWYMRDNYFRDGSVMAYKVAESDASKAVALSGYRVTHTPIGCVGPDINQSRLTTRRAEYATDAAFGYLEDTYRHMQGENWSPMGEARRMIEQSGAGHTSMSCGDIAVLTHHREGCDSLVRSVFMVAPVGFVFLGRDTDDTAMRADLSHMI